MDNRTYDIFLSYRRSDGVYPAYQLYHDLCDANYSTFFDMKSMRSGPFPDQLRTAIQYCSDFILLATKDTFSERIFDEEDWIRIELKEAIEHSKNIIVLFVGEVSFPDKLPDDINQVRYAQSIGQVDPTVLQEVHNKIFNTYLRTRPKPALEAIRSMRCSAYDAEYGNEEQRLYIQSLGSLDFDNRVLNEIVEGKSNLKVLDAGCAHGYAMQSRFASPIYSDVFGIDINESAINKAKNRITDPKFHFALINMEDDNFVNNMKAEMAKYNIDGFDIIFSSYVLHHLAHPTKVVRKLRELLKPGGYLVIRGSDDGSKFAYGDDGLVERIIDKTYKVEGVSDRKNGRKIYSWLKSGGFNDIKIHFDNIDTSYMDFDQKSNLFKESFSYRINYFRKKYEKDRSEESFAEFDDMEMMLVLLEDKFLSSDFWYTETVITGVGKR